jgi:hypothetical protein
METSTVLEIVKTKLQAVDGECESKARVQINTCYESATYNGTRFVVPFFPDVSTVWLELIEEKERRSLEELSKVLSHPNSEIDPKGQVEIEKLVDIFLLNLDMLTGSVAFLRGWVGKLCPMEFSSIQVFIGLIYMILPTEQGLRMHFAKPEGV